MDIEKLLKVAEDAARDAGQFLLEQMQREQEILSRQGRDIKIQADRDAEERILFRLKATGYPALAEETGLHGLLKQDGPFWIVDPLDGTMNFSRGLPFCCVSIALCQGDEPLLGVIYDFSRDECFSGAPGRGAAYNGMAMRVADTRDTRQAMLATGFPSMRSMEVEALEPFLREARAFKKVRMLGSAALMLAYVACGRVDAYAEDDIMFWDVAAGVALVRAAGGVAELTASPRVEWGREVRAACHPAIWQGVH
jgi:myo-inositol-1(or 4)-monophosphatase